MRTVQTLALEVDAEGAIRAVYVVSNPHKLRHLTQRGRASLR
jgi:hypothetical protein